MNWIVWALALSLAVGLAASVDAVEAPKGSVIELWPKAVRDAWGIEREETAKTEPWRGGPTTITRLSGVTNPTLTVYRPPKEQDAGTAVIVCPGGGYSILAWDLEGIEVCQWLSSIGVTGVLLKYRVPGQRDGAFEDAQRAVSVVRSKAKEWGIHPGRIGILGFSAGGHLAARACTNHRTRAYKPIDHADTFACRPDFAVLIYPAYMAGKDGLDAAALPVAKDTPPTFIAIAFADRFTTGALHYALALKKARVRAEMLVFHDGSHGCGLRPVDKGLTTWPTHAAQWMRAIKMLPQ
ncbi:alpha/beta hydrolase [bacterium]|nr:alpha/beta hydrolase [bacterium]